MKHGAIAVLSLVCLLALPSETASASDFVRGDVNLDGAVNLPDAIHILGYLFTAQPAPCLDACDIDASASIQISDPILLLSFLFVGGPPPAAPFPTCGVAPPVLGCLDQGLCGGSGPTGLTYLYTTAAFPYEEPIPINLPCASGGPMDSYSVNPPLHSGIVLDPILGTISGTPDELSASATYTVTASGPLGFFTAFLTLSVVESTIAALEYCEPMPTYVAGLEIAPNLPLTTGGPVTNYIVTPALPVGLTLDLTTGALSGTPSAPAAVSTHTVTAANSLGTATTQIMIEIVSASSSGFRPAAPMNTPRYGHTATNLPDGTVILIGGSDERHFTSLDSAEIFDPAMPAPAGAAVPGDFIDTDFTGNVILLDHGSRVFHTTSLLNDGTLVVIGGSTDILVGGATANAEVYDPATRQFNPPAWAVNAPMIHPRFRHTAALLPDGNVLVAGGQVLVTQTVIDPNFPPGHPLFQIDVDTFPSTETVEIFDVTTRTFVAATDTNGNSTELQTARGRAGHSMAPLAGPDNALGTGDDLYVVSGGFRTLSALFAPQTKFPFAMALHDLGVEYYDPVARTISNAAGAATEVRVGGTALNLGARNNTTPSGVMGVANVLLLTNGDDDGAAPGSHSTAQSELVLATFTGFGPASGLNVTIAAPATAQMNVEMQASPVPMPTLVGRSAAPALLIPSSRSYNGSVYQGGWVLTCGGADLRDSTALSEEVNGFAGNEVVGAMLYDPFYNPLLANPSDLSATVTPDNPTGIAGSWLNVDGLLAEENLCGFGGPSPASVLPLVATSGPRVAHTLNSLPGPDGQLGTADDLVLVGGGGQSWLQTGGDPSVVSAEVFVQP
ncbi:MAG: kelch repeat-containing protein [Planctomycetota bacterium]